MKLKKMNTMHKMWLTLFAISLSFHACATRQIIPSKDYRSYANAVVRYQDIHETELVHSVIGPTSFPSKVGHKDVALGSGWIVVDMGEGEEIVDGPGPDLRIYESDTHYDPKWKAELYHVYISNDLVEWQSIGRGRGVTSFDIKKSKFDKARYVKIESLDLTNHKVPGPDIESIEAINMNGEAIAPVITKSYSLSTDNNENSVAVVIGNKTYESKDIPEVTYAINDAKSIKTFLVNTMGFKEENIIFEKDAKKTALETIFGINGNYKGILYDYIMPDKSDVFIYYSGHGAPDTLTNKAYLLPNDCNPSKIALTGYPMQILYENISQLPVKKMTVLIDACFSGGTNSGQWIVKNASPALIRVDNPLLPKMNMTIITSSRFDQISSWYPEKQHGLFTYFFLSGATGSADSNRDKQITYREIFEFVSDRTNGVPYYAKRLHGGRVQNPTIIVNDRDAVFVKF